MSVDDAIRWLEVVAGLYDGTEEGAGCVLRLTHELVERPESFPEVFFQTVNTGNPVRAKAEQLLRSGVITTDSKFADALQVTRGENEL